ncbi:hypothetical protein ACOME3_008774 [Neoechinorhynchus agilis]
MEIMNSGVNDSRTNRYESDVGSKVATIMAMSDRSGPQDGIEKWANRLKEEYTALIGYVKTNKMAGTDWFTLKSNKEGTLWKGKCWHMQDMRKYEFDLCIEIPASYPMAPPEMKLPQLDGKTAKMYRGGRICIDDHLIPLWARNAPKYGIAHALAIGLAPWLAAEVPAMALANKINPKTE